MPADPDPSVPAAQAEPHSPSKALTDFGARLTARIAEGFAEQQARAEAGLPPLPLSAEAIEYAGRVARRAFWTLYDDDDDDAR